MPKIKAVLFDLDGTLLPLDQPAFTKRYVERLVEYFVPLGYSPKEYLAAVIGSMHKMVGNDGSMTNEEVFWKHYIETFGEERSERDRAPFEEFYRTSYLCLREETCGYTDRSVPLVHALREKGILVALATSPVFPAFATAERMGWVGLVPSDFDHVTTFENSHYGKPNPAYYREVAQYLGVKPEECVMVGNDTRDDMAVPAGMEVFFLTDCLMNDGKIDLSLYPHGDFDALESWLAEKIG